MRRDLVIVGTEPRRTRRRGHRGIAATAPTTLFGSVGPGFSITLRDAQGNAVTRVEPGEFEIEVDDKSEEHNFHLSGPGVDVSTDVAAVGKRRQGHARERALHVHVRPALGADARGVHRR